MYYSGITETEQNVLRPLDMYYSRQKQLMEATKARYEKLSSLEKEAVLKWLEANLDIVPMFAQSKKMAVEQLNNGNYQGKTALFLIRQAFKALNL